MAGIFGNSDKYSYLIRQSLPSDTYKSILVLKKIEEVRSQLSPEEQEYFDQYLFELQQAQDPLKSNAALAVAGVAAIGVAELTVLVAGTGVAACSATKACSDTVEDGLKDTQKAPEKLPMPLLIILLGYLVLIRKNQKTKQIMHHHKLPRLPLRHLLIHLLKEKI